MKLAPGAVNVPVDSAPSSAPRRFSGSTRRMLKPSSLSALRLTSAKRTCSRICRGEGTEMLLTTVAPEASAIATARRSTLASLTDPDRMNVLPLAWTTRFSFGNRSPNWRWRACASAVTSTLWSSRRPLASHRTRLVEPIFLPLTSTSFGETTTASAIEGSEIETCRRFTPWVTRAALPMATETVWSARETAGAASCPTADGGRVRPSAAPNASGNRSADDRLKSARGRLNLAWLMIASAAKRS